MSEVLTKSTARNIFYGGSLFFFIIFVGLTAHSRHYILTKGTDQAHLTDSVVRGKRIWESARLFRLPHHLWRRRAFRARSSATCSSAGAATRTPPARMKPSRNWMKAQPSGIAGRRQMPQFNLTDAQLDDLADFLAWASRTNTQGLAARPPRAN